jgi:hypothetical protein
MIPDPDPDPLIGLFDPNHDSTGHDMEERVKRLDERAKRQDDKQTETDIRINDLQHRVMTLTRASEGYHKIRQRFLEVYRRDVLCNVDVQGRKKISDGNEAAHLGDAVADAWLYTSGQRLDEAVLINLYGLTAMQISHLGKYQTLRPKFMQSQAYTL